MKFSSCLCRFVLLNLSKWSIINIEHFFRTDDFDEIDSGAIRSMFCHFHFPHRSQSEFLNFVLKIFFDGHDQMNVFQKKFYKEFSLFVCVGVFFIKGQFPKSMKKTLSRSFLDVCLSLQSSVESHYRNQSTVSFYEENSRPLYVQTNLFHKECCWKWNLQVLNSWTSFLFFDHNWRISKQQQQQQQQDTGDGSSVRSRSVSVGSERVTSVRFHTVNKPRRNSEMGTFTHTHTQHFLSHLYSQFLFGTNCNLNF
jgi:hypothetical protein